ncbi:MAG: Chromate transporter, partial [Parcubacteria group bacterium GW2011_GWC2_45_7]
LAIPGLFKRQEKAWKLLYYATLLGGLQNIVTMQIGGLIGTLVSLYLLFQVKGYYK